jgi:hypothetical protein
MFAWQEQERRLRNVVDLCKAYSSQTIGVTTRGENEDDEDEAPSEDESEDNDEAPAENAIASADDDIIHLRRSSRERRAPDRYLGGTPMPSQRAQGRGGRKRGHKRGRL